MEPAAGTAAASGKQPAGEREGDSDLVFRAVSVQGERRGIRLEAIFWKIVSAAAAAQGRTLGQEVGRVLASTPKTGNLTSSLRVQAAQWLFGRLSALERVTALESVYAIIHASPTPAFILSDEKKIVQYNQAFLNFIRARLAGTDSDNLLRAARLSLDTQLEQIVELLRRSPKTPVVTGFALGASERRLRGQLKLVLAPTAGTMVIAFITQA